RLRGLSRPFRGPRSCPGVSLIMRRPCLLAGIGLLVCSTMRAQDVKLNDTVGAKPPEGAVVLFDGKSTEGWLGRDGQPSKWKVADGVLTVGGGDIQTEKKFDSFKLHIEFNCPYMPDAKGQARGNSGVYLQGRYELQVLDSYGLPPK